MKYDKPVFTCRFCGWHVGSICVSKSSLLARICIYLTHLLLCRFQTRFWELGFENSMLHYLTSKVWWPSIQPPVFRNRRVWVCDRNDAIIKYHSDQRYRNRAWNLRNTVGQSRSRWNSTKKRGLGKECLCRKRLGWTSDKGRVEKYCRWTMMKPSSARCASASGV